ncbi:MAG: hypothetical protein K2Q33_05685 [Gammaproteobacteria bacterium]|nr:hypothetical protein [Gammaproteobacteria bacterium]
MTLKLSNTLTRTVEAFVPLNAAHVKMYVCGPTVYARPHIGNTDWRAEAEANRQELFGHLFVHQYRF